MSKTTFEKIGIPYEERDGIFYPVIVAGTEKADIDAGKYGRMWIKYIKEEYPMRYKSLVRFGELEERANEVNETAYELLDDIRITSPTSKNFSFMPFTTFPLKFVLAFLHTSSADVTTSLLT